MLGSHDKNFLDLFYGILLVRSDGDGGPRTLSLVNRDIKGSASVLDIRGLASNNRKHFQGD